MSTERTATGRYVPSSSITFEAHRAGVDADLVLDEWHRHAGLWSVAACVAAVVNRTEERARRSAHETGAE